MAEKLEMKHHKALLSATLIVVLVIGVAFGLAMVPEAVVIAMFAVVLLLLVLCLIIVSMLFRTRDELHTLHAELTAHIQAVPERIAAGKAKK